MLRFSYGFAYALALLCSAHAATHVSFYDAARIWRGTSYTPPASFDESPMLPLTVQLGADFQHRACHRILSTTLEVFADTKGMTFVRIDTDDIVSGGALQPTGTATELFFDEFSDAHSDPAYRGELFFCCHACERAVLFVGLQLSPLRRDQRLWCEDSASGRTPTCDCQGVGGCSPGSFRDLCTPYNNGVCLPCTQGGPGAMYCASNQCEVCGCQPNYFYSSTTSVCEPCSVCASGESMHSTCQATRDTVCSDCGFGMTSDPDDPSACIACPHGTHGAVDGRGGCTPCGPHEFTHSRGARACTPCAAGMQPNRAKDGCEPCAAGTFRADVRADPTQNATACEPCPAGSFAEATGATGCHACTRASGGVANESGATTCSICAAGTQPNLAVVARDEATDTAVFVRGSTVCLDCDNGTFPADDAVFRFTAQCEWQCVAGYYRDTRAIACVPCTQQACPVGMTRPACDGTETRSPACVVCTPQPTDVLYTHTRGVHFEYVAGVAPCTYRCLPGYERTLSGACDPCTGLPANAVWIAVPEQVCQYRCVRSFRLRNDGTCRKCADFTHPRTLGEAATFGMYFGSGTGPYVDFEVCNDGVAKEYGRDNLMQAVCGNGVLETGAGEQCDDGNAADGDGCSSTCRLEGNFLSCWFIGAPCQANCGFSAADMHGYYLTDPFCAGAFPPYHSRELCGFRCPARRRPFEQCTHANRGCFDCAAGTEWLDRQRQACVPCGDVCPDGFYGSTCEATAPDAVNLSEAQMGCRPCAFPNRLPASSAVFVGPGARDRLRSCPFACVPGRFFCDGTYNAATRACSGTCTECSDIATMQCPAGQYAVACTATSQATCTPCPARPPNTRWVVGAEPCTWECRTGYRHVPQLGVAAPCDLCVPNKRCDHYQFAPQACDTTGATVGQYCRRCPDPRDNETRLEGVAGGNGGCTLDCISGHFFSPAVNRTPGQPPQCHPCTPSATCRADEQYVPCTPLDDAECLPCPNITGPDAASREFFVQAGGVPSCATRCRAGFAVRPGTLECTHCLALCDARPGTHPSSLCTAADERATLPTCVTCDDAKSLRPPHATYYSRCLWRCDDGYYLYRIASEPPECRACGLCAYGEYQLSASCSPQNRTVACAACELPANAVGTSRTDRACPWVCAPGYLEVSNTQETRRGCAARWIVRENYDALLNPPNRTTPAPGPTPPPAADYDPIPDGFPEREFVRGGGGTRARARLVLLGAAALVVLFQWARAT